MLDTHNSSTTTVHQHQVGNGSLSVFAHLPRAAVEGILLATLLSLLAYHFWSCRPLRSTEKGRGKRPPIFSGSLPFIGHAWYLYRDAIGFIAKGHAECGPIFQYNLFGKPVIVLCERTLIDEYYRMSDEDGLSFAETVNEAAKEFGLVSPGVAPNMMSCIVEYTGSVLKSRRLQEIIDIIAEEGENSLSRIQASLDFHTESSRYLVSAFTRVMFHLELKTTDALVQHVRRGQALLSPLQTLTNILPPWLVRFAVKMSQPFVIPCDGFVSEIQDLLSSSDRWRQHTRPTNQKRDEQQQVSGDELSRIGTEYLKSDATSNERCPLAKPVAELLVFALVLLTDIFTLITAGMIREWASNPRWKERIKEECLKFVSPDKSKIANMKDVVNSKVLNAFLMETVRLNAAALISARKPVGPKSMIGDYDVSHAHVIRVAMKEHMQNKSIYTNPEEFDPDRYLERKESYGSKWNLGWGNGAHKCPAKFLTMTIIKVYLVLFVVNFDAELKDVGGNKTVSSKVKICRGGASSFLNREVDLEITPNK